MCTRTSYLLAEFYQFPNRNVTTIDTANDGPLPLEFHRRTHHPRAILHRRKRDYIALPAVDNENATFEEVPVGLETPKVLCSGERVGEIVCEESWLEESVFEDLGKERRRLV